MKVITAIFSIFRPSNDDAVLDHVPVSPSSNVAAKRLAKARREAAKRHGKPFHCDKIKPRETEPSPTLKSLAAETMIVLPDNVASLRVGAK